jgi:hypothetical protein
MSKFYRSIWTLQCRRLRQTGDVAGMGNHGMLLTSAMYGWEDYKM